MADTTEDTNFIFSRKWIVVALEIGSSNVQCIYGYCQINIYAALLCRLHITSGQIQIALRGKKSYQALCLIATICKALAFGCYLWGSIVKLVWAIIIFIIYAMKLDVLLRFLPWTDFFRAITGTLLLFISSLVCLKFAVAQGFSVEIVASIFGLLAATVFGFDTLCIITQIKELKQESITKITNRPN